MDVSDDADRLQTLLYSSYSADVVRQLERPLLDDGVPLMRMAASAVARVTLSLLDDEDLDVEDARVTVLAGAGDNGGDGLYAGAAAEKATPQTAAFGGQVRGPGQGGGVEVAPPLLFAGDAALFLQPGQQGQQRCAGAGRAGQRRFQLGGGQRRVGIPQGVHDFQLCVGQAFDFGHGMSPF